MKKVFAIFLTLISITAYSQVELNSTGSGNAYLLNYPGVFSYTNGISVTFKANFANTGSASINVNSLGAKTILKHKDNTLVANDIKSGQVVTLVYDGANFQMTSGLGNAPSGGGGGGSEWATSGNNIYNTNTGFVGIGTINPSQQLDVIGKVKWLGGGLLSSFGSGWTITTDGMASGAYSLASDGTNTQLNAPAGNLQLQNGGNPNLVVTASGLVGIGTINPTEQLDVTGKIKWIGGGLLSTFGGGWAISTNGMGLSAYSLASDGTNTQLNAPAGDVGLQTAGNTRVTISNGGFVGIGTTAPSTMLHVFSSGGAGTGFRLVDGTQGAGKVLTSDLNGNATWQTPSGGGGGGSGWTLTGNSGTNPATDFVGTTDFQPLLFRVNNQQAGMLDPGNGNTSFGAASYPGAAGNNNTAIGNTAMLSNGGDFNSALGSGALNQNNSGNKNSSVGASSLQFLNSGDENTALGYAAMQLATNSFNSVAVGSNALYNGGAFNNVAIGKEALYSLTNGEENMENVAVGNYTLRSLDGLFRNQNTAVGHSAMNTVTGSQNTATGAYSMGEATSGDKNTAMGYNALRFNQADNNTAFGAEALRLTTFGSNNVAVGKSALQNNVSGTYNTALGVGTAATTSSGINNTFIGYGTLSVSDGSGMTALGSQAIIGFGATENTTVIGASAFYSGDNAVRLGNGLVTTVEGPVAYTIASDGRFKTNVSATDVKGLDFITRLRPVNYNFDTRKYEEFITQNLPDSIRRKRLAQDFTKSTNLRQTGFIAQEVEKAAKETGYDFGGGLHTPKNQNEYYSVAYSQFVVPLVKAVQELNAKVEALEKENASLKAERETKTLGYKATFTKTIPVTVDDLQNQIYELKKLLDQKADKENK